MDIIGKHFLSTFTWQWCHHVSLPFLVIIQYRYHLEVFFEYFHMATMASCPIAFFRNMQYESIFEYFYIVHVTGAYFNYSFPWCGIMCPTYITLFNWIWDFRWTSSYTISGVDFNGVLCDSSMWHHLFQMLYRHHFASFLEHISMVGHVKMPNKAKVVIPCVVDNMGIILHHFLCTFQWQDYAWENANQSQICDTMCCMQYGHISNHSWWTFQWHGMWQEDVTLKCEI